MIISFADKETEKIWRGIVSLKIPNEIQNVARRKLRMLNNSITVNDLRVPPANHLEKLKGDLKGLHSVRINDQWRIVFLWQDGNCAEVKIEDYH
jgi:proteic killer suppression protein